MRSSRVLLVTASALMLTACNPFNREPAVEVSRDINANTRWRGSLATPAGLAGAVQIGGSASMTPDKNPDKTRVAVNVTNATPGGVHPWQLHRGQCGADEGIVGEAGQYKSIKINDEGRASGAATVELETPMTGNYYVSLGASGTNAETIVACGNLAPPTS